MCLMRTLHSTNSQISAKNRYELLNRSPTLNLNFFYRIAKCFRLSTYTHNPLPLGYNRIRHLFLIWRNGLLYFLKMSSSTGVAIMLKHNLRFVVQRTIMSYVPLYFTFLINEWNLFPGRHNLAHICDAFKDLYVS